VRKDKTPVTVGRIYGRAVEPVGKNSGNPAGAVAWNVADWMLGSFLGAAGVQLRRIGGKQAGRAGDAAP
jgi:hypothetical protein